MRIAILTAFLVTAAASPAASQSLPADDRQAKLFPIAQLLWRAEEPNLVDRCSDSTETIRTTTAPHSGDARIVSISWEDGKAIIVRTTVPRTGRPISATTRIDDDAWQKVAESLESAKFWALTDELEVWLPHGDWLYVEACVSRRYHAVRRYTSRLKSLLPIVHEIDALPR